MNRKMVAEELLKIAGMLVNAEDYEYSYDPDHKKKPSGGGREKTNKGWQKGKDQGDSKSNKGGESNGGGSKMGAETSCGAITSGYDAFGEQKIEGLPVKVISSEEGGNVDNLSVKTKDGREIGVNLTQNHRGEVRAQYYTRVGNYPVEILGRKTYDADDDFEKSAKEIQSQFEKIVKQEI